ARRLRKAPHPGPPPQGGRETEAVRSWAGRDSLGRRLGPRGDPAPDDREDALALLADQRAPRGADALGPEAALLRGELDVLDELRVGIEMEQGGVPAIDLARLAPA